MQHHSAVANLVSIAMEEIHPAAARNMPNVHHDANKIRLLWISDAQNDAENDVAECLSLARRIDRVRYSIRYFPDARPLDAHQTSLLDKAGIKVVLRALGQDGEKQICMLQDALCHADIVIAAPDASDLSQAIAQLHWHPPIIPYARAPAYALRPAGSDSPVPASPEAAHAVKGQVFGTMGALVKQIDRVLRQLTPAPPPSMFRSALMGGWESSTHRLADGRRLDVIAATRHDLFSAQDYGAMRQQGLLTCRDGIRWHLVDRARHYDFTSFTPMLRASQVHGIEVIWDLMHYGIPADLDIWSPSFIDRFAAFAYAVARHHRDHSDAIPFWCPVNEISFMAWAAGDVGYMHPFGRQRGFELKVQLARAAIAAINALRDIDPRARIMLAEPLIAVHPNPESACRAQIARDLDRVQFQTFDLIAGRLWPQIGGQEEFLDLLGLNYYVNNQWYHEGRCLDLDDVDYHPLADLLAKVAARYNRPLLISETGIEGPRRAAWLGYVLRETARARKRGIRVEGLCLYPIADHPGWDDERHCPNGLFSMADSQGRRSLYAPLATLLQAATLDGAAS